MEVFFRGLGGLGAAALLFLGVAGHFVDPETSFFQIHFWVGVSAAIYLCGLHTIVMFHFIGTGADVKEAAAILGGDAEAIARTRRMKAIVFPLSTFSMLAIITGEMLGGGAHSGAIPAWGHALAAWFAVLLNLWTLWIEHRTLIANRDLLDHVQRRMQEMVTPPFLREKP